MIQAQKAAIVEMIRAINAEVGEVVERNIEEIWCAARRYSCTQPVLFLYAQREALDFALYWLAPRVSAKRGFGDSYRVSLGALRSQSSTDVEGASQGWSCDWSNTASYAVNQTNGDSYTRSVSENDSESYSFFRGSGYDRSVMRQDAHSRSDSSRQSTSVRTNESRSEATTTGWGYSQEGAGQFVFNPLVAREDQWVENRGGNWVYVVSVPILLPPSDISIPLPNGGTLNIPQGSILNVAIESTEPYISELDYTCLTTPVRCPSPPRIFDCRIMTDEEARNNEFNPSPLCNLQNYSANVELNMLSTYPIPFIGSFSFGANFQTGFEQRPRCAASRSTTQNQSRSATAQFMRSQAVGSATSRAESRGFRQNNSMQSSQGDSNSDSSSRAAARSYGLTEAESHSGSDTNSHGESQATSKMDTYSRAQSNSWQKTQSDRIHAFDIQKYSDAFRALYDLRLRIGDQIEQTKKIFRKGQFANGRIKRNPVRTLVHPDRFAYESLCTRPPLCCGVGGRYAL